MTTTRRSFISAVLAAIPGVRCLATAAPAKTIECVITDNDDDARHIVVATYAHGRLGATYRGKPMLKFKDSSAIALGYSQDFQFFRFVDNLVNPQAFVLARRTGYGFLHVAYCAIGNEAALAFREVQGKRFISRGICFTHTTGRCERYEWRTRQGRFVWG